MNVISTSQVTGYGYGTQKPLTNEYEYLFEEFPEKDVVKIEQEFKKGGEKSLEFINHPYFLAEGVHLNHEQFRAAIKTYRTKILKVLYFFFPGIEDCLDELQPDCDVKILDQKILYHLRYLT